MKNGLIKQDEYAISNFNETNISALLSLLHGKNDSICKLFKKEIKVDITKLKQLNTMMCDKLAIHNVDVATTSIDITFLNKKILHFKSWHEFENYDFSTITSSTKSLFIQWDFFIKVNGYEVPQRHTVNVRIASAPQPSDMFKVLLSGGFDESHDIDIQGSTMICKVDFINNTLAEELITIVANWNDICESTIREKGKFLQFLNKYCSQLASIAEISTILLICSLIAIISRQHLLSLSSTSITSLWFLLLFTLPLFSAIKKLGRSFGRYIYNSLSNIMWTHIFSISQGDIKFINKIKRESDCKKECILFIVNLILSIVISIIFFLLEKS